MDREKLACRSSTDADAPVAWHDIELRHLELWSDSDFANKREANDLATSEDDVWKALRLLPVERQVRIGRLDTELV